MQVQWREPSTRLWFHRTLSDGVLQDEGRSPKLSQNSSDQVRYTLTPLLDRFRIEMKTSILDITPGNFDSRPCKLGHNLECTERVSGGSIQRHNKKDK